MQPIDWHGKRRQPCPVCDRGPRDTALAVDLDPADGHGVAFCHRCGFVEVHRPDRTAWQRAGKAISRAVVPLQRQTLSDGAAALWNGCTSLRGTVGERYLLARSCALPPVDGDLRYCAELRHSENYTGPALVALLTDATDYRIRRSLHFTWIRADGTKAPVNPPRRLLAGHRKAGAVCRLWPDEAVSTGLGIAEGIESALSLAHGYVPVWAAIDASNLSAFPLLAGVESLTIAADNDPAGIAAAEACATRWATAGREVFLVRPPQGCDLNDVARAP